MVGDAFGLAFVVNTTTTDLDLTRLHLCVDSLVSSVCILWEGYAGDTTINALRTNQSRDTLTVPGPDLDLTV